MTHPLEQQLRKVRRRVRALLALHGVAWVTGCVLGAVILIGLVDYLLRFRDPGIRLFCSLTVAGLLVWSVRRYLVDVLRLPWHDAELARRLGRAFPALGDALPSAIEFLHQKEDDPTAGSFALRRAVVVQATADVEKLDLLDAVRIGPVGKVVGVASAILVIALSISIAAPASAGVALSRLANPFGETVWPQNTYLAVLQSGDAPPLRLRPHDTFEPIVRDLSGKTLPETLRIHYRFDPASSAAYDEARVTHKTDSGRLTRRVNVEMPFAFRFVVGDEPWSQWCEVRVSDRTGVPVDSGEMPFSKPVRVARILPAPQADEDGRQLAVVIEQRRAERAARGSSFEVELVDARGAKLPGTARVFYRWRDDEGRYQEEEGTVQHVGGRFRVLRENVTRDFEYRVEAGDDRQMPWIPVEVVPAPQIEKQETQVTPPAYTGLPVRKSETLVRALVGSRVGISATANRSLAAAVLCSEEGERRDCTISGPDQRTVEAGFEIEQSASYWFELTDSEGLQGGGVMRWDVRALSDAAPTVTIEEPIGNIFVTPQARIPLRIGVKDDLAVRNITMQFSRDDEAPETVALYQRPADAEPPKDLNTGEVRSVDFLWTLGDLALQPGSQIALHIEATDELPQLGRSETRRVSIITPEELAERIATRQSMILSELARVLEMQRDCRRQTAEMEIRLREIASLSQPDVDRLRGAELNQRQVNRSLTATGEGVPMHVTGLLADLDNNGIDNPDVRRRMEDILFHLDRLGREHLPQITLNMTAAIKGAQIRLERKSSEDSDTEIGPPLNGAGVHQDAVISALEDLLGQLAQWENYRQFHRRMAQLLRAQKELATQTATLAQNTLGKSYRDLTPQEIADGKIQARRQAELARDLDRIEDEMRRTAGELQTSDPLAAETLADALAESRRLALSVAMHDAGQAVDENRMGQATTQQQRVIEGLERVLDILGNRREYELARLIRRLQQAEEQLGDLARRQGELQKQMEDAAKTGDAAARRRRLEQLRTAQEAIQKETEQASRQIERLSADDAAQKAKDAQKSMQQSGDSAKKDAGDDAAKKADEARKQLEEAKQKLADRRRQAEAELAFEQMARLEDGLKALRRRQQATLDATVRLDTLLTENTRLSDAQRITLASVAREQALLQEETDRTRDELQAAAVFQLVLSQTAGDMAAAHDALAREETGAATQNAQKSALARLDQIIEALQPEEPEEKESDENQGGGQGQGQGQNAPKAPGDALKAMAELKLLKLMQTGINARTQALEDQYGTGDNVPEEARKEYARLSQEQGHLADLLLGLMQEMAAPEDDPQRLPGLDPDNSELDLEGVR